MFYLELQVKTEAALAVVAFQSIITCPNLTQLSGLTFLGAGPYFARCHSEKLPNVDYQFGLINGHLYSSDC